MQIEDHLTEVRNQMATGKRKEPARLLEDLIGQMGPSELSDWRLDIVRIVNEFERRARRNLLKILDSRNQDHSGSGRREAGIAKSFESPSISPTSTLVTEFRSALDELRKRHIFQWSTFYRDCLESYFDRFLSAMRCPSPDDLVKAITKPVADHTQEVFSQGYTFVRRTHKRKDAINKSLNGLSQFLAVPLDYYSTQTSIVSEYRTTVALRLLFSAALSGILEGYSRVRFDEEKGSNLLAIYQRQWVHYVAFLTPKHAEHVIDCVEPGQLVNGLKFSALPLLDAVHRFYHREEDDYWPIPVLGQYSWNERRLDISIRPPRNATSQRLVETRAFLEESFVKSADLDHALGRQVALVLAPLKPDMSTIVNRHERLRAIVVSVDQPRADTEEATRKSRTFTAERAFKVLDEAVYALRSKLEAKSPITYNFAREFPLHHLYRGPSFFHVIRTSVRDLLRTFERRDGVRLWCSIRRSGKTTACFDMETTTGDSIIVGQTCSAPPSPNSDRFYLRVRDAVESGRMVSNMFVQDVITECAPVEVDGRRTVLIIDEYETLFGVLKNAETDDVVRYNVVQPILDQLVTFSRNNLLVLLGQRPSAYSILMDQNQLAPHVEQDSFPLFEHVAGTSTGEFSKLVDKILLGRIECTAGFLDALHKETAGHPYLTANVLVEFVDWLIERRRPQSGLRVQETDFRRFARQKLEPDRILLSPEYDFFRDAAEGALSEQGYRSNPWLFGVYWVLRELSSRNSSTFRISHVDFQDVVNRIPIPRSGRPPDCSALLRTASQANFLSYDQRWVSVPIRTLGRIVAAVRPALA